MDPEEDVYEILEIPYDAEPRDISKAYHRKALRYHPDKNPDNAIAASMFLKVSKAYQILSDPKKKADFDGQLKAKLEKKKRMQQLDSKRRKLREDLESKEQQAKSTAPTMHTAQAQLEKELARLREMNKNKPSPEQAEKEAKEEQERAKRLFEEVERAEEAERLKEQRVVIKDIDRTLKLKWESKKHAFSEDQIRAILLKFGELENVIISAKKKGLAIVLFRSIVSAHDVVSNATSNEALAPFSISWAGGSEPEVLSDPAILNPYLKKPPQEARQPSSQGQKEPEKAKEEPIKAQAIFGPGEAASKGEKDYESVTLMRMRQAEERRKLIEQLQKDQEIENE